MLGRLLSQKGLILAIDVDKDAINDAKEKLKKIPPEVVFVHDNFKNILHIAENKNIQNVHFILADIGISSPQLTDTKKGLSFSRQMPLDMRIDKRLKTTAADIINKTSEEQLADLFFQFGQEKASRKIAKYIVRCRDKKNIQTTTELADIICKALGRHKASRKSRIHPATRAFQALRIAVNQELDNLGRFLNSAPVILRSRGRIAVISYHSLEDRMVKNNFKQNTEYGLYRLITKKPIRPDAREIRQNPRSRSAKLRIAEKL